MELKIHGTGTSKIIGDDSIFGMKPNEDIVHQAVLAELSNRHQGTHASKSRGMVRGGGRKPFRQKGRGAARAGTIRSPLWKGGGVVFGPKPHSYKKSINRKMRQLARKSVLSSKASEGAIFVVDEFTFDNPKTSQFNQLVKDLKLTGKRITVLPAIVDENLFLSVRNLKNITLIKVDHASTYDLIDNDILLFDKAGIMLLNEQLKN
ncbi:MAG TPA: 50S ribosomal protein L4 [Candidatus Marinimicrobia bacterium]|nr:50S ribosomal protein L4 [Candidatus Neomarinimicrobiota bacterium]